MHHREQDPDEDQLLEDMLGYVNFSSGSPDPKFLLSMNQFWRRSPAPPGGVLSWKWAGQRLRDRLASLPPGAAAFEDTEQASRVLELVWEQAIPGYLDFHRDLLFHQNEDDLLGPFFVGRVCEAVLRQGPPWDEVDRIVPAAISELNDYVGYRPVPVLESRRIEPFPQERVRPVPLFIRGAGVTVGRYQQLVERALELLESTDEDLLRSAYFDPQLVDELAFDPRAYDFDHPVNKRPNYHFGLWDPHHLDNQGRYRRFVVQQVTLDALLERLNNCPDLPREELLFEAAAVLACTVLMASGVSGSGPETHDSTTTLANLLPRIAAYRDTFYERLIHRTDPNHTRRLQQEAIDRRQPFGAARQHLNAQLARRRASQLEHVQLARIFARMGYPKAAVEQANAVPVASARFICQMECRLTAATHALDVKDPARAADLLQEVTRLLHAGIACGAIVDPWNILGFDAQFSLFPALENSVHDHRADELVELIEQLFGTYSRVWSEAAVGGSTELCPRIQERFRELVNWWRGFAAHEVAQVEAIDAQDALQAAEHVTRALNVWHKKGAAAGDIGFWAPHAEMFDTPQAYALVIDALLDQSDFVASMGLLMHWLASSERVALEQADSSFYRLAERWFFELRRPLRLGEHDATSTNGTAWEKVRKFLDFLEANAGLYWEVPDWQLGKSESCRHPEQKQLADEFDDEEEDSLYRAAYEDVVYQDSTDDGMESSIFEYGDATDDELVMEADRLSDRLAFLSTTSRLWRSAALSFSTTDEEQLALHDDRLRSLRRWSRQAAENQTRLLELLGAVHAYRIPALRRDHDSMLEYDRRRVVKESLLERIIATAVETADASRLLRAAIAGMAEADEDGGDLSQGGEQQLAVALCGAILRGERDAVRELSTEYIATLSEKSLLYVPLNRGGDPHAIVATRARQRTLQDLLRCLPRLGLLVETCRLIETAREMERAHPVGPGAVTEFDELFKIGWTSLVDCLVVSAKSWDPDKRDDDTSPHEQPLIQCLERLTEALLISWLGHSRTLRLSVLEKVNDRRSWKRLREFVERYGGDLFTQQFLNLGNLRAILHQGVERWLQAMQDEVSDEMRFLLLEDLEQGKITAKEAAERLGLVLEAIVENYAEYRDYNSTTTQSDRGELLYTLLDFLRLRANYDRICWNLKPVILAHERLVRRGRKRSAQAWRRALRERIQEEASKYEARLATLQKKHAMQMPSIADRIAERFIRPLVIDRIRALVPPAIAEASREGPHPTFRLLKYETEFLTREPSGVGFDVPAWLVALDEEVQRVRQRVNEREEDDQLCANVPEEELSFEQIKAQIETWTDD
jgi:hypothetical protein